MQLDTMFVFGINKPYLKNKFSLKLKTVAVTRSYCKSSGIFVIVRKANLTIGSLVSSIDAHVSPCYVDSQQID